MNNWEEELKEIVERYNIPSNTKTFLANDIIDFIRDLLEKELNEQFYNLTDKEESNGNINST